MRFSSLSLPARVSLGVALALVATTIAADAMALRRIRAGLAESVSEGLAQSIRRLAGRLDGDIADLQTLLRKEAALAAGLPPAEAADMLAKKGSVLDHAFSYGVVLVNSRGEVAADSRGRIGWRGVDLAGSEFFQRTFALRRSVVSSPFPAPLPDGPPIVVLTAPVIDPGGRMTGMLAGCLDLTANRVLAPISSAGTGRYGQIGVFTREGLVVAHTDPSLILHAFENPMPPGAGREVREVTTADGERAYLAVAELANADWVAAGTFSSRELYRTVSRGFASAHLWLAAGMVAACFLVWLISGGIVRDLWRLAREVETIGVSPPGGETRLADTYRNEAGMLAASINSALAGRERAQREVEDLNERLARSEERERRRIAADLHDSVGQTLALANLRLGELRRRLADPGDAGSLDGARALIEQAVGEMRTLVFDLSPGILYELGLGAALDWQSREFGEKYGLAATSACAAEPAETGGDVAVFLYRAAGELLANAARHAQATAVKVEVSREGDDLVLSVADNGRGMAAPAGASVGFGLRHLRERARQFGGRLETENNPEGGARVTVRVRDASSGGD